MQNQLSLGCAYLPRNEIHRKLTEGLKRSIMVVALGSNQNNGGVPENVQHYLYRTYGGSYIQYFPLIYFKDVFLFQLPVGLGKEQVIEVGNEWGAAEEWSFRYFYIDEDAAIQPKLYRVRLHITNFPLDFWDETFIYEACAGFEEVVNIDEQFIIRNNRSKLALDIVCIDPRRIPPATVLPYGRKWKKMYIYVASWEYNARIPEEAILTRNEKRSLISIVEHTVDYPRVSLLASHDKLHRYLNTPDPPTPSPSPSYFSDDAADMEYGAPDTNYDGVQTLLIHEPVIQQLSAVAKETTDLPGEQLTNMPKQDKGFLTAQVGDISLDQGIANQFPHLNGKLDLCVTEPEAIYGTGFRGFSMQTYWAGKIKVLQKSQQGTSVELFDPKDTLQSFSHYIQPQSHMNWQAENKSSFISQLTPNQHETDTSSRRINIPFQPKKKEGFLASHVQQNFRIRVQNRPKFNSTFTEVHRPTSNPLYISPIKRKLRTTSHNSETTQNQLSIALTCLRSSSHNSTVLLSLNNHNTFYTIPPQQFSNCNMDLTDEQIVEQFVALSSGGESSQTIHLPQNGLANKKWSLCALAKIVTDKSTVDQHFALTMMSAWGADPSTEISILKRNHFLV